MKKKVLSFVLVVCLLAGCLPLSAGAAATKTVSQAAINDFVAVAKAAADNGKTRSDLGLLDTDWCAYFVSYCLSNSKIGKELGTCNEPYGITVARWVSVQKSAGYTYFLTDTDGHIILRNRWCYGTDRNGKPITTAKADPVITENEKSISSISAFRPKAGDIIHFHWNDKPATHDSHVGIVYDYNPSTGVIRTIEGNTAGRSGPVCMKTRNDTDTSIYAFTRFETGTSTQDIPTAVKLGKTSLTLTEGDTQYLYASYTPSTYQDWSKLSWSSSNTSVATVNNDGLVTAKKAGTATITVKYSDSIKATCKVTVKAKEIVPTSVKLNKSSISLADGKSQTLTATVSPSNATDKTVTWSTSNKSVATVSNGKVTAVKAGTATITVKTKTGGKTATCKVTVTCTHDYSDGTGVCSKCHNIDLSKCVVKGKNTSAAGIYLVADKYNNSDSKVYFRATPYSNKYNILKSIIATDIKSVHVTDSVKNSSNSTWYHVDSYTTSKGTVKIDAFSSSARLKSQNASTPEPEPEREPELEPGPEDVPFDPTPENSFIDVPNGAYFADAVNWAVDQGVTSGTSKTTFSPNAICTRAQAVTFLWRAAGSPEPSSASTKFVDVPGGQYYTKAVQWAVENRITGGTSSNTFSPNDKCTRAQIVTFQYRMHGSPSVNGISPFTDVPASLYYADAVAWAVENGITSGTSASTFSPHNDCSRGQIVTFLYRDMGE